MRPKEVDDGVPEETDISEAFIGLRGGGRRGCGQRTSVGGYGRKLEIKPVIYWLDKVVRLIQLELAEG